MPLFDSLTQKYNDVFSELNTADQDTHLEAAVSILDTMEGVAIAETLYSSTYCDGLFRVYTASHRGCSQQEEAWP